MTGKDDFGTIEAGKRADFILLENNPLADISNIRHPLGVMTSGIWLPGEKLTQMMEVKRRIASSALREVMARTSRADSVIIAYDRLAGNNYLNEYYMTEGKLTVIGYEFIKNDQPDEAIKIFKHNIEEYPYAPNPYYYLGETYMMKGENEMAAGNFCKALEMDPNFKSAREALTKLGK